MRSWHQRVVVAILFISVVLVRLFIPGFMRKISVFNKFRGWRRVQRSFVTILTRCCLSCLTSLLIERPTSTTSSTHGIVLPAYIALFYWHFRFSVPFLSEASIKSNTPAPLHPPHRIAWFLGSCQTISSPTLGA